MKKTIFTILLLLNGNKIFANDELYIFVSFSMNNQALIDYFYEAEQYEGILKIRGVEPLPNANLYERLMITYEKIHQLKINAEIDPELFTKFAITEVPTIVRVKDGQTAKISGHISLEEALRIFDEAKK